MPIPIQVAFIALLAALIGTAINFLSSLLGHWYSRNAAYRNWLFAKQVTDVEEILGVLKSLVKVLEEMDAKITAVCHYPNDIVFNAKRLLEGKEVNSFVTDDLGKTVRKPIKENDLTSKAYDIMYVGENFLTENWPEVSKIEEWAKHDVPRLTMWFEDAHESEVTLRGFSERCTGLISDWVDIAIKMKRWPESGTMFKVDEHSLRLSERFLIEPLRQLENARIEKEAIAAESIRLQKLMAERIDNRGSFWDFFQETVWLSGSDKVKRGLERPR